MRLTPSELHRFKVAAAKEKRSLSNWLIVAALEHLKSRAQ
jgi:hypothetical protein